MKNKKIHYKGSFLDFLQDKFVAVLPNWFIPIIFAFVGFMSKCPDMRYKQCVPASNQLPLFLQNGFIGLLAGIGLLFLVYILVRMGIVTKK